MFYARNYKLHTLLIKQSKHQPLESRKAESEEEQSKHLPTLTPHTNGSGSGDPIEAIMQRGD